MEDKLEKIRSLTNGKIEELGFNLYHLEYVEEEGEKFLRFHIRKVNNEIVLIEDCETVSRAISTIIDVEDPIDEPYFLEVQSAGDFRELFTEEHINEALGLKAIVDLVKKINGAMNFNAILEKYDNGVLTVKTEKELIEIKKENIARIRLNP